MRRRSSLPEPAGVAIVDLLARQCRFPIASEGRLHRFCGAPTLGKTSWCSHHLPRVASAPGVSAGGRSLAEHIAGRPAE